MTGGLDPDDIRACQRLSDRVTTSGKLDQGDPARLAAIGVRHVINLALGDHSEALADAPALMAHAELGYTHIPIPFDAPEEKHYAAFVSALAVADGPVHVHCIMNYRVLAFFYRLNRERGMPEAEARALMRRQWDPLDSDDPRTLPWRRIIEG